ncbi:conserved hypothetical protein [Beutenbergia cavernae DSM 12333]|uniref:ATP synthase protein I n=1 Tax=Beutenbergia cavernae (strain ATCC BAA-8 / DSM 12333 / CCUG 43141 / JCM 11478 / NBRC 16432 / NCIMB 13614 / HKI 0122) TaxID=471853 RepID=C5C1T3_BEUC1|nr:hypothetical protein [Beutenbergia cavernae]ACQ79551.1 conserved hypothetical protein [Beutenbergia cavernae DSM 12333]
MSTGRTPGTVSTSRLIAVLRGILRRLLVVSAIIVVLGAVVGLLVAGTAGLWGALLGAVAAALFCGTTLLSMILAVGREPTFMAAIVLGMWLLKMVLIIALLIIIDPMTFYDRYVFAGVLVAVVLASLALDVHGITTARIPNVEPEMPARSDSDD